VTALAHVSDESSIDNDSFRNGSSSVTVQMQPVSVVERSSTARYEPIPLQVPHQEIFNIPIQIHQQQYPLFSISGCTSSIGMMAPSFPSAPATKWEDVAFTSKGAIGGYKATPLYAGIVSLPISSKADHVLDDAVDELFSNTESVSEDVADLDDLWDPVAFGETDEVGRIENDLQLGNLLETFLEQY
jgi:hypothetical protein